MCFTVDKVLPNYIGMAGEEQVKRLGLKQCWLFDPQVTQPLGEKEPWAKLAVSEVQTPWVSLRVISALSIRLLCWVSYGCNSLCLPSCEQKQWERNPRWTPRVFPAGLMKSCLGRKNGYGGLVTRFQSHLHTTITVTIDSSVITKTTALHSHTRQVKWAWKCSDWVYCHAALTVP